MRGVPDAGAGAVPADRRAVEAEAGVGRRAEAVGGLPQGLRPGRCRRGVRGRGARREADGDAAEMRSGGDNGARRRMVESG